MSFKGFQKISKFLNFRKANYPTENSENSGKKVNSQKEISVNFGTPRKVVLFSEDGEKRSFIRHWKFPQIPTRVFGLPESTV